MYGSHISSGVPPGVCPVCGENNLIQMFSEIDEDGAHIHYVCQNMECGCEFVNTYSMRYTATYWED